MQHSLCHSQRLQRVAPHRHHQVPAAGVRSVAAAAKKGFGGGAPTKQAKPEEQQPEQQPAAVSQSAPAASTSAPSPAASPAPAAAAVDKEAEIEAMLRRRKNRRVIEPQVKVQSAAVDMVTGKAPASPVGEVETLVVQVLGIFFFVLLTEGLVLAGSGFLPAEWDPFFRDVLYPSFSPQMLLFLGMSSAYGLWKTGKLPGQKQM